MYAPLVKADDIKIGVLANSGKQLTLERWQPTAKYLSNHITNHQFNIVPLSYEELEHAINKGQLSFILTNPGNYVDHEVHFGITRIATFLSSSNDHPLTRNSSVIFTRADSEITGINDLKGHTLGAVGKKAFCGFQLAQETLLDNDIDVLKDMKVVWLGFPYTDIVNAVLSGKVDVGTVRTGVLEKMADRLELDLSKIHILTQKKNEGFPLLHSANLYPEWPLAKLPDTDATLAKKVVSALLLMQPSDNAAIKSQGVGWTIPVNYTSVHKVLHRLKIEPHPEKSLISGQFLKTYGYWLALVTLFFLLSITATLRFIRANKKLRFTQQMLHKQQNQLEETVQQRTNDLCLTNQKLQDEVIKYIKSEQTLNNGCDALQSLYGIFLRDDLTRQQRLSSILESMCHYLGTEIGLLSRFHGDHFEICKVSPGNATVSAPLSKSLSTQAKTYKEILINQDIDGWKNYIACPVYIKGNLHCLFEFAASPKFYEKNRHNIEATSPQLSLKLLNFISQWMGQEVLLLERENEAQNKQLTIKKRFSSISPREKEVLALLVQGETTKDMARTLNLSAKTIEMHRANLIRKTEAKTSTHIVQLAVLAELFTKTQ